MKTSERPDCYDCKYLRQLGQTRRSMCHHPDIKKVTEGVSLDFKLDYHGLPLPIKIVTSKGEFYFVVFHKHGEKFRAVGWPYSFDPAFLLSCVGFEKEINGNLKD